MKKINFGAKIICDNVYGSIGVSLLEQQLINTRTFQRLKKIKQLGLASYVFPDAEHSRFAHSIGAMHVMSQMIDRLREQGCTAFCNKDSDEVKQMLRIAALLHDVGHYPLSHLGERAFQWADTDKAVPPTTTQVKSDSLGLLAEAAVARKGAAMHEKISELIITHDHSELRRLIEDSGLIPEDIALIINGAHKKQKFFVQLMSSTLDCDRIDFLLRDSLATGTSYGNVDIRYIIENMRWDKASETICFNSKAINALEHFVMARYFMYQVYFHKTIVGFELMAVALLYSMIRDQELISKEYGPMVRSVSDIESKIRNDKNFLSNFNDEYFWYYLDIWRPKDAVQEKLKHNLLERIPLRTIHEERVLEQTASKVSTRSVRHYYIANNLLHDMFSQQDYVKQLKENGVDQQMVVVMDRKTKLEQLAFSSTLETEPPGDNDKLKLIKILQDSGAVNLMSLPGSVLNILSDYELRVTRMYALLDKDSEGELTLKRMAKEAIDEHTINT